MRVRVDMSMQVKTAMWVSVRVETKIAMLMMVRG